MFMENKDTVLIIKHSTLKLERYGGLVRIYMAKAKDLDDKFFGLVNEDWKIDFRQLEEITSVLMSCVGTRLENGMLWFKGISKDRSKNIAEEIVSNTEGIFSLDKVIHIYTYKRKILKIERGN